MKEIKTIVDTDYCLQEQGIDASLATVVKITGSAYRRPGAHMLIGLNGERAGTISGGCLEADVIERAKEVIATSNNLLVQYDTNDEYDKVFGTGLGCNGTIQILIEKINRTSPINPLRLFANCLRDGQSRVLATVIASENKSAKVGQHALIETIGQVVSNIGHEELKSFICMDAHNVLQSGHSLSKQYLHPQGQIEVFLEVVRPPIELVIFGAGDDAIPLTVLAKQLGFNVTVCDPRKAFVSQSRFPTADCLLCLRPEEFNQAIVLPEQTAVVVMSHNFLADIQALETALPQATKYIGILGPAKRTERLLGGLSFSPTADQMERLQFPIGLDLGAETADEIALSIISEIQACLSGRNGGFLKDRKGPIHQVPAVRAAILPESDGSHSAQVKVEALTCPMSVL